MTAEEHWSNVRDALGLSDVQHAELVSDLEAVEVFDTELAAFVASLRGEVKTAILSNLWSNGRLAIRRHGGEQLVDEVFISAEIRLAKPHLDAFTLALERLGVRPREAVFVDDSEDNIAAASALGLEAIHYENTPQAIAAVREWLERPGFA